LFLATWETFEAHGASWSVHHQQTPLLLGVELVDIVMLARFQVSGCLLLVGRKISVFIYKKGWLACSTEVKQKFDTTVESVYVYLCTMWAAHIGNYIDLLMNIINILDFIAMFWNWKRDKQTHGFKVESWT
jgi:lipoprotein signal peptidase